MPSTETTAQYTGYWPVTNEPTKPTIGVRGRNAPTTTTARARVRAIAPRRSSHDTSQSAQAVTRPPPGTGSGPTSRVSRS